MRISALLQILNQISFFAKLVMAKRIVIMNKTISKLLQQEEPDQVHVVIFKYNSTSSSYLQQCSKPLLYIRDRFRKKLIAVELFHKWCTIRIRHQCLIYRTNPPCTFEQIIFSLRRRHIKLQLGCQSNIEIIQQAKFANEAVIWEDKRESVTANQFFAEETNHRFIRAITEVKRYKEKGFYRDLRYYLKWVYLCMGALTTIAFAATVSTLIAEFHFQHQHYLAKNKPVKLIINRELLNQVRLAKRALHPIVPGT
uniref:Bm1486, isoform c n=1 Tax=Brugia malayi TaxID=6279 RepID=A0A0J9Y1A7_BRUMA|nr:Bm1486, isoform c [Brugia malayi]